MQTEGAIKALRKDAWLLSLAILIGTGLRLDLLLATNFRVDADEAIVGLMAKHIMEGGPIPVFYYGQHYLGSLEALLAAAVFAAAGVSEAALKIVPLLFSIGLIPVLYLLTLDIWNRRAARIAAFLTAICPSMLLLWSGKARGGFIEVVFLGALSFVLLVRWLKSDKPPAAGSILIGLLLGFAWWVNNQAIYFIVPAGIWMTLRFLPSIRPVIRHGMFGSLAFFIGGAAFWNYQLRHEFITFGMFGASQPGDIFAHAGGLFGTALPIILGARRYWQETDLFPGASLLVWLAYGTALAVVLWERRSGILSLAGRLRIDRRRPVELLLFFMLFVLAVYCVSPFGALAKDPRYLLPLYIGIIVTASIAADAAAAHKPLFGALFAVSIAALNGASLYVNGRAVPGEPHVYEGQRVSPDHAELVKWLESRGIEWIRTNYWIGYRLAFETREKVRFALFGEPQQVRIEQYQREAEQSGLLRLPLVLVPAQTAAVRQALDALGYVYAKTSVSGYDVIHEIHPRQSNLQPLAGELLKVEVSSSPAKSIFAVDGDINTRWGSGEHQRPGMRFAAALESGGPIRGLRYVLGRWSHDFPRGLRIILEDKQGRRVELCDPQRFSAVQYFGGSEYFFYFDPIDVRRVLLLQEGEHPVFDWSIAELTLYR